MRAGSILGRVVAEDPRVVGSHLFRRSAQGRHAGGMTVTLSGAGLSLCLICAQLSRSRRVLRAAGMGASPGLTTVRCGSRCDFHCVC
jgi:hypothetical protein